MNRRHCRPKRPTEYLREEVVFMNLIGHFVRHESEDIVVLVPEKRGLGNVNLKVSPPQITFGDGKTEEATIYVNKGGDKICVPKDLKKLLGL
jgi:hypothetical protein